MMDQCNWTSFVVSVISGLTIGGVVSVIVGVLYIKSRVARLIATSQTEATKWAANQVRNAALKVARKRAFGGK